MEAMRAGLVRPHSAIVVIAFVLLTGCSESSQNPREVSQNRPEASQKREFVSRGSCALAARLDGRSYLGNGGFRVIPTFGDVLGTATIPPCEDADGFGIDAMSIVGVSPEIAFAAPRYAQDVIFIAAGIESLPPELQRLRLEPRCEALDVPIVLNGPWLGIIGADGNTEVDLVPPYDLSMRVDEASVAHYERSFLTIHVAPDSGRPLTREDVRTSLWEGGNLSVTASCLDGLFMAEEVTASPPS
jgi:hypothetical protein